MRRLLALLLAACGATGNDYEGKQVLDAGVQDVSSSGDVSEGRRSATPCVSGEWLVRFVFSACPLCVAEQVCRGHQAPPWSVVAAGETLPLLNCVAERRGCRYESAGCSLTYAFDGGEETLAWDGEIRFAPLFGGVPVAASPDGRVVVEEFGGEVVGTAQVSSGLCPMLVLLTKDGP